MDTLAHGDLRLVVNTQTPLVRLHADARGPGGASLADLTEGVDYELTTGGVVRMLLPLLERWIDRGFVRETEWVAMGSEYGAPTLTHRGVGLSFVPLPESERRGYSQVKERMWALLNSNPSTPTARGGRGIPDAAWLAFDAYQARSAEALREAAERIGGIDLLYVHDFQQIGVAAEWKGPRVPKLFHLHTPFPSALPSGWAEHLVARLSRYEAVVVSTRRYADNLRAAGLATPIHVVHPFIDPRGFRHPSDGEVAAARERLGISPDDRVILNVARMDPMKGQDRLLHALPRVLAEEPRARLVLVGNGSFSSAQKGGLGLDKGRTWRAHLESLARELAIDDRVTFTGHLPDDALPAVYAMSEVFALPSTREGFGLAAIEAWRYGKPIVVCDRAGVSELVEHGVNGLTLDCADPESLADGLASVLADPARAERMGEEGLAASHAATLDVGERALARVFDSVLEERAYALA